MNTRLEPWQQRDDWSSGWIESTTGGRVAVVLLWMFTLLWNVISWFAMIGTLRGTVTGSTEVAPIFPAIGLGLIALAVYITLQHRKWGRSRLELLTRPGVIGGPLRCVLHASQALARAEALEVSIDCRGPEPGKAAIRLVKHLWHYEGRVLKTHFNVDEQLHAPLEFRIPYGLPESDPRSTGEDATWILSVRANVPGVNYAADFELPVFQTSESLPEEEGSRAEVPPMPPSSGSDAVPVLPDSKIRVRQYGLGGREVVFGMLRNPWIGLFSIVFTLIFCGIFALIFYAEGPLFVLAIFAIFILVFAKVSVDTFIMTTRVLAERGCIRIRHGPLGIGPMRTLYLHEIERIRVLPQGQHGTGTYYQIRIECKVREPGERTWGRWVTAGSRIPTQAEAESLAQAMRKVIGT